MYPQKWHLPEGPMTNDGFHRVLFDEIYPNNYYYVHVEYHPKETKPGKRVPKPEVYDLVVKVVEEESWHPNNNLFPSVHYEVIYKRPEGKRWTASEDKGMFFQGTIDLDETEVPTTTFSSLFYVQTPPRHIPGVTAGIEPSPGTFHYDWLAYMRAQREGRLLWDFTHKRSKPIGLLTPRKTPGPGKTPRMRRSSLRKTRKQHRV